MTKSQGTGRRNRSMRAVPRCGMKLKLILRYGDNGPSDLEEIMFKLGGDCREHNHTLDLVDSIKVNDRVKSIAAHRVSKGRALSKCAALSEVFTEDSKERAATGHCQ